MYLAGIFFLILTKFIGQRVYGARSWLHLGPINFQPAQLAVVAGIMVLALFLSQFRQMHPMLRLLLCGAIVGAPCLLIMMQPDLGETIIWAPVLLALFGNGLGHVFGIAAWVIMALAFQPTLRLYRVSPVWGVLLPAIALAYVVFTLDSAYQHARGAGGLWKGRAQAGLQ